MLIVSKKRPHLRIPVIAFSMFIVVVALVFLPRIFEGKSGATIAKRPEVKVSSDETYDYEFDASTFKLFIGELAGNPSMLVKQGSREMEITFFKGEKGQFEGQTNQDIQEDQQATQSAQTENPKPTQMPTTTTATPQESSENIIEGLEKINSRLFSTVVNAQTTTPLPSGDIGLTKTDTEQFVQYQNTNLKIEPFLDKVSYEKVLQEGEGLPSLYVNSTRYHPEHSPEGIIFQTRTNRHAFAIENVLLTDANGDSVSVTLDSSNAGQQDYIIGFVADLNWINDSSRAFPLALTYDFVSLFHDRMLAVFPSKLNFRAFEPLEFEIDIALLNDTDIQGALENDRLGDLKFGTIDAKGKQKLLVAKIKENSNGIVILGLEPKSGEFKPGIFDLLIQYKDKSAYIAEEDFTWGVLAINPDMSVYPLGSTAKLDIAVLDKYGEMVCDADLLLRIENPNGNITELSTEAGDIDVSDTCFILMTDKPDYSASYHTGIEGEYKMTLSAITKDGSFVITDSFKVSQNSSFYIKRVGPTRIYPILEYEMELEVISATDSGEFIVEEYVPLDFEVSPSNSLKIIEDGVRKIMQWEENFSKGQTKTFSYSFDAPDVSPAMFLLGPVRLADAHSGQELFSENRSWQIASDAVGIENTGTCTISSSTSCATAASITITSANLLIAQVAVGGGNSVSSCTGAGGGFTNTNATYGSTGDTPLIGQWYRSSPTAGAQTVNCTLGASDKGVVTVFGLTGVNLSSPGPVDTTSYTGATADAAMTNSATITTDQNNSYMIMGLTYLDNGTITSYGSGQNQINQVNTNITGTKMTLASTYELKVASGAPGDAQSGNWGKNADTAISVVEVVEAVTGPTTNQLMRHGNYFSSGVEQYFYWAN